MVNANWLRLSADGYPSSCPLICFGKLSMQCARLSKSNHEGFTNCSISLVWRQTDLIRNEMKYLIVYSILYYWCFASVFFPCYFEVYVLVSLPVDHLRSVSITIRFFFWTKYKRKMLCRWHYCATVNYLLNILWTPSWVFRFGIMKFNRFLGFIVRIFVGTSSNKCGCNTITLRFTMRCFTSIWNR